MAHRIAADLMLLVHVLFVAFVVLGLLLVLAGIGIVVLQAWLGRHCGLTNLESWLRVRAGQAVYDTGFVQYWVERFLYHEAPGWVFALTYTVFGILVALAWWYFPPRRTS